MFFLIIVVGKQQGFLHLRREGEMWQEDLQGPVGDEEREPVISEVSDASLLPASFFVFNHLLLFC